VQADLGVWNVADQAKMSSRQVLVLSLAVICIGVSAFFAILGLLSGDEGEPLGYPIAAGAILSFVATFTALIVWARRANAPDNAPPTRLVLQKPKLDAGSISAAAFLALIVWQQYYNWRDTALGPSWTIPAYNSLSRADGTLTEFSHWSSRTFRWDEAIIRTADGRNLVLNCTPGTRMGACFGKVQIGNWIYHGSAKLNVPVTVLYFPAVTNHGDAQNILVELRTANAVPISRESRMRDLDRAQVEYRHRMTRPNIFHLFMLALLGFALYSLLFKRVPIEPASASLDSVPTGPLAGRDLRLHRALALGPPGQGEKMTQGWLWVVGPGVAHLE
jgi:hypothetical protein